MKRYLELYPNWQQFLANYMGLDWNNQMIFKEYAATEQGLEMLKAMVYVLHAVKIHFLSLKDPAAATGSMLCQVLEGLVSLLKLLSRGAAYLYS